MPLTNYALDTFVGPNLSSLMTCGMPKLDRADERKISSLILNHIFVARLQPITMRLMLNTIRRIDAAYWEYNAARAALIAYTSKPGDVVKYFRAVRHLEQCLAATHGTILLARKLIDPDWKTFLDADSPEHRVRELNDASKHLDDRIFMQSAAQDIAAQKTDLKNLSDQVAALAAKIDALQPAAAPTPLQTAVQLGVPVQPAVIEPHKKTAPIKPTGRISVGGAPLPAAADQDGKQ